MTTVINMYQYLQSKGIFSEDFNLKLFLLQLNNSKCLIYKFSMPQHTHQHKMSYLSDDSIKHSHIKGNNNSPFETLSSIEGILSKICI